MPWCLDVGSETAGAPDFADDHRKDAAMMKLRLDCDMKAANDDVPPTSATWWWQNGDGRVRLFAFVHPKHAPTGWKT